MFAIVLKKWEKIKASGEGDDAIVSGKGIHFFVGHDRVTEVE